MTLHIEEAKDPAAGAEMGRIIAQFGDDIDKIIDYWTKGLKSVTVMSGWEDDNDQIPRIYFLFQENNSLYAAAYLRSTDFPKYISEPEKGALIPPPIKDIEPPEDEEDAWHAKRNKLLGITWNEELCSACLSLKDALKLAYGYALSEHGEVTFTCADDCFLEDIPDCSLTTDQFLSVHALQSDKQRIRTWQEVLFAMK